jgi:UDP:flavonoid glycosyltransferase YjiC (YdhE family)
VRVIVSSSPGYGHVLPMVPLARALLAAGHEVLWGTGRDACLLVSAAGIDSRPAGLSDRQREEVRRDLVAGAAGVRPDQLEG